MIATFVICLYAIWQFARPMHQKKGVIIVTCIATAYWTLDAFILRLSLKSLTKLQHASETTDNSYTLVDTLTTRAYSIGAELIGLTIAIGLLLLIMKQKRFKTPQSPQD